MEAWEILLFGPIMVGLLCVTAYVLWGGPHES